MLIDCDCGITDIFEAFMVSGKRNRIYALFSDNPDEEHKKALAQKLLSVPCPDSFRRGSLNVAQFIDWRYNLGAFNWP